jgi:hypothetical protein
MPRLRNDVTGVIVNVDDKTAESLTDRAAGGLGNWVDADADEKPARRKASTKSE